MSERLPLTDGPCAGQAIPVAAVSRNSTGTFLFEASDGSRHEYRHDAGKMVYAGLYDGPWYCNSQHQNGYHSCQKIIQPNEFVHEGQHECCCGKEW